MYAHIRPDRIFETGVIDPYNPADPAAAAMNVVGRFKRAPWMGETGNGNGSSGSMGAIMRRRHHALRGFGQSPVPTGVPPVNFQQTVALIARMYAQMTPAQQGILMAQLYQFGR